jgi:hypothetical protein
METLGSRELNGARSSPSAVTYVFSGLSGPAIGLQTVHHVGPTDQDYATVASAKVKARSIG